MKDLRTRILVSVSAVVGVSVALLLLYIYVYAPSQEDEFFEDIDNQTEKVLDTLEDAAEDGVDVVAEVDQTPPEDPTELYLRQLARDFVEKFGTYSSQNRNKHIEDVFPMVTSQMSSWLESQKKEYTPEYSGSTTNVIVNNIKSVEGDKAVVSVGVQQVLSTSGGSENIYKNGDVHFVKQGSKWKISGLFWEE